MSTPAPDSGIPFAFLVDLVDEIAKIKLHKASEKQPRSMRFVDTPAYKTFRRWVEALRDCYSPLPVNTTASVFRLLFPEEDVHRKYGLQETRLAQYLVKILGVSSAPEGRGERLKNWEIQGTSGCLGEEVKRVMSGTAHSQASSTAPMTLQHVDELLTELAAKCGYSASTVHQPSSTTGRRRSREAILKSLYTSLTPTEAAVVTQIILKDLRPLLHPVPESASHYTAALLEYKSNAVIALSMHAAMHAWDPSGRFAVIYTSRANLEEAARAFERFRAGEGLPLPQFGAPIKIPKCAKGQGTEQSLRLLRGADKVWVETKYDGERAQIHVRLLEDGTPEIKIYSKSGRDSTLDRAGIHGVICAALGLNHAGVIGIQKCGVTPSFQRNIVVEAEMVAYSDVLNSIDEFWRIRSIIATTAIGIRHKPPVPAPSCELMGSQCSLISNGTDGGTRHLALVFFDVLVLDDVSLLSHPYSERRAILEQVIETIPSYSMLAERTCVKMTGVDPADELRKTFARLIADHQEGAVLKADGASYGERRWPWVKLKRDYIQGYGDCVDLVLLAASWDKDRARELRVLPNTYTTFYFGALKNYEVQDKPHFQVLFSAEYGLSRENLEELNFIVKSLDPVPNRGEVWKKLPYTFTSCSNLPHSAVLLTRPLLAELSGAGFTKAQGSLFYELRFPRVVKFYRPSDRPWSDGLSLTEYQHIARTTVGRDRPGKAEDDWARTIFRSNEPASPGVRCPQKRKETESLWIQKLELADGKVAGQATPLKKARVDSTETRRKARSVENAGNVRRDAEVPIVESFGAGHAENTASESLRTRTGLARLGSVTNLANSPAYSPPLERFARLVVPSPTPMRRQGEALVQRRPSPSSGVTRTPPSTTVIPRPQASSASAAAFPQLPQTPPPTVAKPAGNVPYTSPGLRAEIDHHVFYSPPERISSPPTIHRILQDSVVWLAHPADTPRPTWRAPSHAVIPTGNRVFTLDAILLACGWSELQHCVWAKRGLIFVDPEGHSTYMENALSILAAKRAEMHEEQLARCRTIFVLSLKMLAYDALNRSLTVEEMEAQAICRFG